jgi:hypothetical protein
MSASRIQTFTAIAAIVAAFTVFGAECARAQTTEPAAVVKDYEVFVDLPSAFAFIKLPTGWKFIGKLDADQLRHLPPDTLTTLLPPEAQEIESTQLAHKPAARKRTGA